MWLQRLIAIGRAENLSGMAIEASGLILQLGFVNNLGPRRARRAGSLLIALGVIGTIASIIWWQNFYGQMIGRAPSSAYANASRTRRCPSELELEDGAC